MSFELSLNTLSMPFSVPRTTSSYILNVENLRLPNKVFQAMPRHLACGVDKPVRALATAYDPSPKISRPRESNSKTWEDVRQVLNRTRLIEMPL